MPKLMRLSGAISLIALSACESDGVIAPKVRPSVYAVEGMVAADGQQILRTVHQFPSSGNPSGVAVRSDGIGLVAHSGFSLLSVIDAANIAIVGVITVGPCPSTVVISPNGHTAYVGYLCSQAVGVVDVDNRTLVNTISLTSGSASALALSNDGAHLYVGTTVGSIDIIDTQTLALEFSLFTGLFTGISGLTIDSGGTTLFASSFGPNVLEFDLATHFLNRVVLVGGVTTAITFSKAGTNLIVGNDASYISDIVASTGFLLNSATTGPVTDVVEAPTLSRTLFTLPATGLLGVYDEVRHRVTQSIPIGGNLRKLAIHAPSKTLVITDANGFIDFVR